MKFLERTLELIEQKGITKNKLLTDLKISSNSFVAWESRNTIPNGETLSKIANYFECSVDYLLGRTNDPAPDASLTQKQKEALDMLENLSDENLAKAIDYLELLTNSEK